MTSTSRRSDAWPRSFAGTSSAGVRRTGAPTCTMGGGISPASQASRSKGGTADAVADVIVSRASVGRSRQRPGPFFEPHVERASLLHLDLVRERMVEHAQGNGARGAGLLLELDRAPGEQGRGELHVV